MDNSNVVKRLLDSMFENNELISATVKVKSGLSLFNIRFNNAILDPNLEPVTYVKKTNYHATRDKERSELYRQSQRQRKQTQLFDSSKELLRSDDHENSTVSAPGLSPIRVIDTACNDRHSSSPFLSSESPNEDTRAMENKTAVCSESSSSDGILARIARVESLVREFQTWESSPVGKTNDTLELPDCLDTPIFRTHVANMDKEWSSIKCLACGVSAFEYAKQECHMMYCAACPRYSCEDCNDQNNHQNYSEFNCCYCDKPIFDITGPRTDPRFPT